MYIQILVENVSRNSNRIVCTLENVYQIDFQSLDIGVDIITCKY